MPNVRQTTDEVPPAWDHTTDDRFFDYYKNESVSSHAVERFRSIRDAIVRLRPSLLERSCSVADIGCGAGTQSRLWAELGCKVHGLDVNERLLELGRVRNAEAGYDIDLRIGSAVSLPWPDESMQVCLAIELLEHVSDWQTCLAEFCRVVGPGGVLFLTTSNALCPFQQEFRLPLYSWYPSPVKKYFERLAVTTRPQLASYAKYPAVNWFTFYQLRDFLRQRGFECFDRFELVDAARKGGISKVVLQSLRASRVLRFAAYIVTEGTSVLAVKTDSKA